MSAAFHFDPIELPPECEALRGEVRGFIAGELAAGHWVPNSDFGSHRSAAFSRRLGERGWIGMTWPKRYGGSERSMLERYVVTEELLAAGAPVGAHWIADRQSAPLLLRYGTEEQRLAFLPGIARGERLDLGGDLRPAPALPDAEILLAAGRAVAAAGRMIEQEFREGVERRVIGRGGPAVMHQARRRGGECRC